MEFSWEEIVVLLEHNDGRIVNPRDPHSRIEISGSGLRDLIAEVVEIATGERPLHKIAPDDIPALYARLQQLEEDGASDYAIGLAIAAVEVPLKLLLNRPDADFDLGTWECEGESPTGHCICDLNDEDLAGHDECIFCGQPNERK